MSEPSNADPSLDRLRSRRGELKQAMADLETAAAAPVPGREAEWTAEVARQLAGVHAEFAAHIEVTEGPDGIHDQMIEIAPRLTGRVRRLVRDHEMIQHELEQAEATLAEASELAAAGDDPAVEADADATVEEVRRRVTNLLTRLSRHRQRGSDLVWEAFSYDLGGET